MTALITALDRRHKGFGTWHCFVSNARYGGDKDEFWSWLRYCQEMFGPGIERDLVDRVEAVSVADIKWAWFIEEGKSYRVYFKKDECLSMFTLRFGGNTNQMG